MIYKNYNKNDVFSSIQKSSSITSLRDLLTYLIPGSLEPPIFGFLRSLTSGFLEPPIFGSLRSLTSGFLEPPIFSLLAPSIFEVAQPSFVNNELDEQSVRLRLRRKLQNSKNSHLIETLDEMDWRGIEYCLRINSEEKLITLLKERHQELTNAVKGLGKRQKIFLKTLLNKANKPDKYIEWNSTQWFSEDGSVLNVGKRTNFTKRIDALARRNLIIHTKARGRKEYIKLTEMGFKVAQTLYK